MSQRGFTTRILHSDLGSPIEHNAIHKPVHMAVSYGFSDVRDLLDVFQGKQAGFVYGRQGTPTTSALEAKINKMEPGVGTATFGTGMAAISAVFLTLLKAGDHLIASKYLFGNTSSVMGTLHSLGIEVSLVDAVDVNQVAQAIQANTRMVFVETIANPGTQIADLVAIGELCQGHHLVYVVDSTLTSPYLMTGESVGASLVVHSLTKYMAGHGNALGGSVTDTGLFDWTRYPNINEAYRGMPANLQGLTQLRKKGTRDLGASLSGENAHRIAIGAETLALRMKQACDNALTLAEFFEAHPMVKKVHYPGLRSHPQHQRAKTLFKHFGALLSIELVSSVDVIEFMNRLSIVISATHLGDNRSLAIPVAHTIYWEMGAEKRAQMGIDDGLIRISVGIEDIDDLLADFTQALV